MRDCVSIFTPSSLRVCPTLSKHLPHNSLNLLDPFATFIIQLKLFQRPSLDNNII